MVYHVRNNDGTTTPIRRQDMFHIPGIMSEDGITGKGVIDFAAESIGMGLATERYGAAHFGNGGGPSIVLTHPKRLDDEGHDNLRREWNKRHAGLSNANGVMILEEDTKVEHLSFPPEANQFLLTRQFNITEIARWYKLAVHLLREMSKSSFDNITSESLHFVLTSLMPWLVKFEAECDRQLLTESDQDAGYYFKFILQGMLRGDMTARADFYEKMSGMGVFTVNNMLELEDLNPIGPEGDIRVVSQNVKSLDVVFRESQEKPELESSDDESGTAAVNSDSLDAEANVQATALNGAQITSLLAMALNIATGDAPADGTRAMIEGSFPAMEQQLINTIVDDFAKFEEEREDEPEVPGKPVVPEVPPADKKPPEDDEPQLSRDDILSAARTMFVTAFERLRNREAISINRAASSKERNFLSGVDRFLDIHGKTYVEQIDGPLSALAALNVPCDATLFAETMTMASTV